MTHEDRLLEKILPESKDYGCDDCPKLKKNHCSVWQIKIDDPHNSSCESINYWINQAKKS